MCNAEHFSVSFEASYPGDSQSNNPQQRASAPPPLPQMANDAAADGAYEVCAVAEADLVDPGESVTLKIFFTGYGAIRSAKFYVAMSEGLLAKNKNVSVRHSVEPTNTEAGTIELLWGGAVNEARNAFALGLVGVQAGQWPYSTLFFDWQAHPLLRSDTPPQIFTECYQRNAPVEITIPIAKKSRPGAHRVSIVLTYFNGTSWSTAKEDVTINVRNTFQRHELAFGFLGVVLTSCAIIPSIIPLFDDSVEDAVMRAATAIQNMDANASRSSAQIEETIRSMNADASRSSVQINDTIRGASTEVVTAIRESRAASVRATQLPDAISR